MSVIRTLRHGGCYEHYIHDTDVSGYREAGGHGPPYKRTTRKPRVQQGCTPYRL